MALEEDSELCRTEVKDAVRTAITRYTDRVEVAKLPLERSRTKRQDKMAAIYRDAVMKAPICIISGAPHVYVYTEGRYCPMPWTVFGDAVYDAMRDTGVLDGEFGRLESLIRMLIRAVSSKEKEIDNGVVVLANGVYDTRKHKYHSHSKRYIAVTKADWNYDPNAECPLWQAFLDEVLPVKEHQGLLQECIAAAYVDRSEAKIEHVTILKGNGANGKSVIFATMLKLFGEQNVSTFSVSDLINNKREQNIAACNGKRMNYCSEIRTSEINESNADAFKALVSGEPTMARALYREPFIARNIPLLFANANILPKISDPSLSIRRRIVVIPFAITIPIDRQDKELPAKLEGEIAGIFNWVMRGLMRLQAGGYMLPIPADIANVVDSYMLDNNTVARWLSDSRYFSRPNDISDSSPIVALASEMYSFYHTWCSVNAEQPVTSIRFGKVLCEMGFVKTRKNAGMAYDVYVGMSDEEARIRGLQEALEVESAKMAEKDDNLMDPKKGVSIVGIQEAEKHLGLQEGSLAYYYQKNLLDGTFTMSRGKPRFFLRMIQRRLAALGYYNRIGKDGRYIKDREISTRKRSALSFNNQMKQLGLPFYKRTKASNGAYYKVRGLIEVGYEWELNLEEGEKLILENRDRLGSSFEFYYKKANELKNKSNERKKTKKDTPDTGVEQ